MPKARAAPNVSQKNKKERNLATPAAPLAALQPRRVSTGMPNVTRRLEKHVALARRGPGHSVGGGEGFQCHSQVGRGAARVGTQQLDPEPSPGAGRSHREPVSPRGDWAWVAGRGAPPHGQPLQGLPAALASLSLTPNSRVHFLFNPPINPSNILIHHSSPPRQSFL